jgi:hypothetical protein
MPLRQFVVVFRPANPHADLFLPLDDPAGHAPQLVGALPIGPKHAGLQPLGAQWLHQRLRLVPGTVVVNGGAGAGKVRRHPSMPNDGAMRV